MSAKKLISIALIYFSVFLAWMILGVSNQSRTSTSFSKLKREVASLYGDKLIIKTPQLYSKQKQITYKTVDNKTVKKEYFKYHYSEISKTNVNININLDQRKKGNLWFPTYKLNFKGNYTFKIKNFNPKKRYYIYTTLESTVSIYRDIELSINNKNIKNILPMIKKEEILIHPNKNGLVKLSLSYNSTGMDEILYYISYKHKEIAQINNFQLKIKTDFNNFDFPGKMMSPVKKIKSKKGFDLIWNLDKAVTGKDIGLIIPNKLNPGEIVTRVTFFAPVSLLFFFIVLFMLAVILKINLHPMHYFFLAASFFSFHLMYSYFSDHIDIYITFGISSLVSLLLTTSYLKLFTPKKVAYVYGPLIQFIYLVLFSFSFFFKGMTGVILTICSVATLFFLMQMTGRINWDEIFKKDFK